MDTNTAHEIASLVKAAIDREGFTKSAVAQASGIPWTTFSRKCSGDGEFKLSELLRIAEEINVAPSDLVPSLFARKVAA